jgi:hypothetical protein
MHISTSMQKKRPLMLLQAKNLIAPKELKKYGLLWKRYKQKNLIASKEEKEKGNLQTIFKEKSTS